jgi:hypothetical protein
VRLVAFIEVSGDLAVQDDPVLVNPIAVNLVRPRSDDLTYIHMDHGETVLVRMGWEAVGRALEAASE